MWYNGIIEVRVRTLSPTSNFTKERKNVYSWMQHLHYYFDRHYYGNFRLKEATDMAKNWYWFIFTDGTRECAMGFSKCELATMERKHGKLMRKILA